jgi:hypothetical protein
MDDRHDAAPLRARQKKIHDGFSLQRRPTTLLPDVERVVERTDVCFAVGKIGVAGQFAASDADGVRSTVSSTGKA